MKKVKGIRLFLAGLVILSVFTQCKKDIEDLLGTGTSTIKFINPTYTSIDLTFNGIFKTIPPGGSVEYTDDANTVATGFASTSGKTVSGTQVGQLMTWNGISLSFPSGGGSLDYTLNVGSDYFFLKMQNLSTRQVQKVLVNYGLISQTIDNISVPNDGITYSLGYYQAYSNSNVRAESGSTFWYWNPLNLGFTNNQSKTVVAN